MADQWKMLLHNGKQQDGREHIVKQDVPLCGAGVRAGVGFTGTWATEAAREVKGRRCQRCRRLAGIPNA